MQRRILCLYFPGLAIDRLEREDPSRRSHPLAVIQDVKGHPYIAAVNRPAADAGLRPGVRLADARALLPSLDIVPDDPPANARVKRRWIAWCDRYSPLVSGDGANGIVLDITGCAHLYGGEAGLLRDVQSRITRSGYRVRGAIACTLGAAWALARYGKRTIAAREETPDLLDPLPVQALRLPMETAGELRRLGIATIAAVCRIPRQSLAARYGPAILLRLDQAFGSAEEPFDPYRPPAPYRALRKLAEPLVTVSSVQYALLELLKEICARLEKDRMGARRLKLDCYRVDGTVAECDIGVSKPVRSASRLIRLFSEKLETLDSGFGIEAMMLSVPTFESFDSRQLAFSAFDCGDEEDTGLDIFLDRLGMRLGFQDVCRFRIRESFLPEYAAGFEPVTAARVPCAEWPDYRVRPVCLVDPPARIEVQNAPPIEIRMGHRRHRIVRAEGPERLAAEWWRDDPLAWEFRDYYRIEDDSGARFWIFVESNPPRWYLRGYLP